MLSIYNLLLQAHEWRCYAVYRRVYGEGLCFDAAHPRRAGRHAWQGYPVHRRPHVQKLSDNLKRYVSLDKIALDEGGVAAPELARYVKPLLDRLHIFSQLALDLDPGSPQVADVLSATAALGGVVDLEDCFARLFLVGPCPEIKDPGPELAPEIPSGLEDLLDLFLCEVVGVQEMPAP
jgi:hypothetical protein